MVDNNAKKRINNSTKNNGQYIFSDFSKGLYLIDTPRSIGEQLSSLALIGGRNIWSEKGALVSQHGYLEKASIDTGKTIVANTKSQPGTNSFFLVTLDGEVYLYTANQGLKKYKTTLPQVANPVVASRNKDMIIYTAGSSYMFGAYYEESTSVDIVTDVQLQNFGSYYQAVVPIEFLDYFWNDKEVCIDNQYSFTVLSVVTNKSDDTITLRLINNEDDTTDIPSTVSIGEKTSLPIDLIYEPENEEPTVEGEEAPTPLPSVTLIPQLMEVSNNRLFIVHITGDIYYSRVGVMNDFSQSFGAGYFGGFYQDTSKTLSIEEFLEGTLISKENGIYFLTIGDQLSIKKISQVGQKYASDHVIVGEKVYAFDTNSGAIVNAVSVNVFGAMVSGKPVITSEFLDAENSGINSSRRFLTYNAENEVFVLYYGENLNKGIVLTNLGTLFPRQIDKDIETFIGFNQGVVFLTSDNKIVQDFKKGSIIPNLSHVAVFEPIGLRDNRLICSSILEVTELNGIEYQISTENAGTSFQKIVPSFNSLKGQEFLPPLLYSDDELKVPSFELTSKWAEKSSNVTRLYAPMSGRNGVSITVEFPANTAFCLSALRLPDFSQGN
ncbi:MAG: hypothetical protein NC218_08370 [Acetobacter sp.]|nr:hypothetical protein [Acetobacter sp.]